MRVLSVLVLVLFGFYMCLAGQVETPSRPYKSPLGLKVDGTGQRAYVALHTGGTIAVVDLAAGKVSQEIAVGAGPHDIAVSGKTLFVSCEHDDTLVRVDLEKGTVTGRWKVDQAPHGVALVAEPQRIVVACHDGRSLCRVDPASGKVEALPVPGWPDRLVREYLGDDYLLVLTTEPGEARISEVATAEFRITRTDTLRGLSNPRGLVSTPALIPLSAGSPAVRTLVVHQNPRTQVPATQVTQGWVFTNLLTDFARPGVGPYGGDQSRTTLLDEPNRAYTDPSDVVALPDSRLMFVACAGADSVLALRQDPLVGAALGPIGYQGRYPAGRQEDLALTRHYVKARLTTQANPRRLALSGDGKVLVAANYLGDSLTVIDTQKLRVLKNISLGSRQPDAARRGEVLFHSGKMTFHGQFSCASCHPGGGSDGLTWDLSRDGIGNFMNTRSLHGVRDTAPYGWLASSPTLEDRITGTLRNLHHHEPQGTEVADLAAYLQSLPPPRPLPIKEADRPAIARGQALFQGKGKCANCHRRPALDDETSHDVGTRIDGDMQDRFDTPSLRGVARTAPYLHHGQARTLAEIFSKYNPRQRHGAAHQLTPAELVDLIAYLKSL